MAGATATGLDTLDPAVVVQLDLGANRCGRIFIRELSQWALGQRPKRFAQIKADSMLIPAAVEEALRYHGADPDAVPRYRGQVSETQIASLPMCRTSALRTGVELEVK